MSSKTSTRSTKRTKATKTPLLFAAVEELRQQVRSFSSVIDLVNYWTSNQSSESYKIHNCIYKADVVNENTNFLPPTFYSFTIDRDAQGRVLSVKDKNENKKLKSETLKEVLALAYAQSIGANLAVFKHKDGVTEGLFIADFQNVEVYDLQEGEGRNKPRAAVYTTKAQKFCYHSVPELFSYLSLPYVQLGKVARMVSDLNRVSRVSDLPPVGSLQDLSSIQSLKLETDLKASTEELLSGLMASALEDATLEERVQAFVKSPSATFARSLKLSTIYPITLRDQSKAVVSKVLLSDLEDEDLVTMSLVPISESEYSTLPPDPSGVYVTKYSDNLGILKNGRWKKASSIQGMPKALLLQYYAATAATKTEKSDAEASESSSSSDEEMEEI